MLNIYLPYDIDIVPLDIYPREKKHMYIQRLAQKSHSVLFLIAQTGNIYIPINKRWINELWYGIQWNATQQWKRIEY